MPVASVFLVDAAWPLWTAAALLGAWLTLDETSWIQTWFSQPLPAALLAGLLVGDVTAGLLIGLPFQLATIGNLPVGQSFLGDKPAPVVGVVVAAAGDLEGVGTLPWAMSDNGATLVGWLLILLAIASILGHQVVHLERRLRIGWSAASLRNLRDGNTRRLDQAQRRCLTVTLARGAATTVIWGLVAVKVWIPAASRLPILLGDAMAIMPALCPAVAVGALAELYGSRRGLRWLGMGLLGSLAVAWLVALRVGGAQ